MLWIETIQQLVYMHILFADIQGFVTEGIPRDCV